MSPQRALLTRDVNKTERLNRKGRGLSSLESLELEPRFLGARLGHSLGDASFLGFGFAVEECGGQYFFVFV